MSGNLIYAKGRWYLCKLRRAALSSAKQTLTCWHCEVADAARVTDTDERVLCLLLLLHNRSGLKWRDWSASSQRNFRGDPSQRWKFLELSLLFSLCCCLMLMLDALKSTSLLIQLPACREACHILQIQSQDEQRLALLEDPRMLLLPGWLLSIDSTIGAHCLANVITSFAQALPDAARLYEAVCSAALSAVKQHRPAAAVHLLTILSTILKRSSFSAISKAAASTSVSKSIVQLWQLVAVQPADVLLMYTLCDLTLDLVRSDAVMTTSVEATAAEWQSFASAERMAQVCGRSVDVHLKWLELMAACRAESTTAAALSSVAHCAATLLPQLQPLLDEAEGTGSSFCTLIDEAGAQRSLQQRALLLLLEACSSSSSSSSSNSSNSSSSSSRSSSRSSSSSTLATTEQCATVLTHVCAGGDVAQRLVLFFSDHDSYLFDALCFALLAYTAHCGSSTSGSSSTSSSSSSSGAAAQTLAVLCAQHLQPAALLQQLLRLISHDATVLLDWLMSPETRCLQYLVRAAAVTAAATTAAVAAPAAAVTADQQATNSAVQLDNDDIEALQQLAATLRRLHSKQLFPYDPSALVARLQQLCACFTHVHDAEH
jgi:Lines N-terminus/Lines C-terminus